MSIVAQQQLFSWKNIEKLGDLERLNLVLEYIPMKKSSVFWRRNVKMDGINIQSNRCGIQYLPALSINISVSKA